ncbi:MAG TPA: EamA family transporter [Usitatibacteraceae bacterium]
MNAGVLYALSSAVLFGLSTPLAKLLLGQIAPLMLAGLLYLGSGFGLLLWFMLRRTYGESESGATRLLRADMPWLAAAVLAGGVAGPALLMLGLSLTAAAAASLLLNLEGVFTAALAWFVFKENFDRRIFLGMLCIVIAGALLSWQPATHAGLAWGTLAIVGACLCWAIDNNLTRKISASDAVQIACIKGLVAGSINLAIALAAGAVVPGPVQVSAAGLLGFVGYGLSLVLFVLALRHLGTARTGAYFSAAPFVGALIALLLPGEAPGLLFWIAAALMALGLWLHLSEHHSHPHQHQPMQHAHSHVHDEHHQHRHDFAWDGREPHVHEHAHGALSHEHPHFPDIHHQHGN